MQTEFEVKDDKIIHQTHKFDKWSEKNITEEKKESFKFFYGKASPPKKISKLSIGKEASEVMKNSEHSDGNNKEMDMIIKGTRYNFHEINMRRAIETQKYLL